MEHYLRIDTTDLGTPMDDSYTHGGLLTPLPSATEERRGSIQSSEYWLGSLCGSASSVEPSQDPSTPPGSDGVSGSYCVVNPDLSLSGFHFGQQSLTLDPKSSIENGPATPHTPVTPMGGLPRHSDDDWIWVGRSDTGVPPTTAYHSMMPASGDFESAFGSSLHYTNQGYRTQFGAPSDPGNSSHYFLPVYDPWKEGGFIYEQTTSPNDIGHFGGTIPIDQLRQPLSMSGSLLADAGSASTIVPADMFGRDDSMQMDVCEESSHHWKFQEMSASPSPQQDQRQLLVKVEDDPDSTPEVKRDTPKLRRRIGETTSGGKTVKKERRCRTSPRRKHGQTQAITSLLPGGNPCDVSFDGPMRRDGNGKAEIMRRESGPKHHCKICAKGFARVEHLTRHIKTHYPIKEFECPVANCNKDKKGEGDKKHFNRNDNLQEHYKTHLQVSKAGRNIRMSFEALYALIRDTKEEVQAEKSIRTLENWRKNGKNKDKVPKA